MPLLFLALLAPPTGLIVGGPDVQRVWIEAGAAYGALPLTIEMDVRLPRSDTYHILIARGPKRGGHWELYTTPGEGRLSWYVPDLRPGDIASPRSITDDRWHRVAWRCDGQVAELYVDGERVQQTQVTGQLAPAREPICFGGQPAGDLGCEGQIGAVRLSAAFRELAGVTGPLAADPQTGSLWLPEHLRDGRIADAGPAGLPAYAVDSSRLIPFERMLDEVDRDDQLALGIIGDPAVEADLALPVTEVTARPVADGPRWPEWAGEGGYLGGKWLMQRAEPGRGEALGYARPDLDRSDWIPAEVPGSIQSALLAAGRMPDPFFGDTWVREVGQGPGWPQARREPERFEWWLARTFEAEDAMFAEPARLIFQGVDYSARFYLNGELLGAHTGLFGGPEFDLTGRLMPGPNHLAVCIDPPPGPIDGLPDWRGRPKPSVVFGWHYGHLISMGLTGSVLWQQTPPVEVLWPRVTTLSLDGEIEIELTYRSRLPAATRAPTQLMVRSPSQRIQQARIEPTVPPGLSRFRTRLKLRDPQLWWPMGYGRQPIYGLLAWTGESKSGTAFGLRTVEMRQAPGSLPGHYRWQFVINGRPMFIKGANWCFTNPLRLPDDDPGYAAKLGHILELARRANVQMLRAWGGGPIESDLFYDLCDAKGILVWQEFPYCFDAPDIPASDAAVLDDQAARAVRRLRNHPSLVAWAGGNEVMGQGTEGTTLRLLGKRIRQLDPTRPYHITSPWGGDVHNWNVYHGGAPIEAYRRMPTPFLTEYGLPSSPGRASLLKYLRPEALDHWPPTAADLDVISHSQQFSLGDWGKMLTYAGDWGAVRSWDDFITQTQLAQGEAFRYGGEMMRWRAGRGGCGFFFYKLTDIFPGQAWACVDYYGTPKLSYWQVAELCQPRQAFANFERYDWAPGERFSAQIAVGNDSPAAVRGQVEALVYDADGRIVHRRLWPAAAAADETVRLGELRCLVSEAMQPFAVGLLWRDGPRAIDESWYWFNVRELTEAVRAARALPHWGYPAERMPEVFAAYAALPPSRLRTRLAKTTLEVTAWRAVAPGRWSATVTNTGRAPAYGVTVDGLPDEPGWFLSANAFSLRPGAGRALLVEGPGPLPPLTVSVWNGVL